MAAKSDRNIKVIADNRKARFNYEIGEVVEAGIALTGTEVKSLRNGRANIAESYADARGGLLIFRDIGVDQPDLAAPRIRIGFRDIGPAIAQRLDLGAGQRDLAG